MFSAALGSCGGAEVVIVDLPVSDDLKMLFERDIWWYRDICAVQRGLWKGCWWLENELLGLR